MYIENRICELRQVRDGAANRIFSDKEAEILAPYMNLLEEYFTNKGTFIMGFPPEWTAEQCVEKQISDFPYLPAPPEIQAEMNKHHVVRDTLRKLATIFYGKEGQ